MGLQVSCCTSLEDISKSASAPASPSIQRCNIESGHSTCSPRVLGNGEPSPVQEILASKSPPLSMGKTRTTISRSSHYISGNSTPPFHSGYSNSSYSTTKRTCRLLPPQNPFEVSKFAMEEIPDRDSSSRLFSLEELEDLQLPDEPRRISPYVYHIEPKWLSTQEEPISIVSLRANGHSFITIQEKVQESLHVDISKIERVQNLELYRSFASTHETISKSADSTQSIKDLFYGTGRIDPYSLCTNPLGLDSPCVQVFSQPITCFAEAAKESFKFAYKRKDGMRQILLCAVIVGEPVELEPGEDVSEPPILLDRDSPVLSVKVKKGRSNVWVVYEKCMSYPSYIITISNASKC